MPSRKTDKGRDLPSGRAETRRPRHRRDPLAYRARRPAEVEPAARPRRRGNRRRVPFVVRANRFLRDLRSLLLPLLLLETLVVGLTTPRLAVRQVQVAGSTRRTPAEIAKVAGLTRPMNVFMAPAGKAERRIAALPEVGTVDVVRVLPGTLSVNVVERTPVATVITDAGLFAIDDTGFVFRALRRPLPDLPLLRVRPKSPPKLGSVLALATLRPALATMRALRSSPLPSACTLVVDTRNGATVLSPDGLKVRLGPVDNGPARLATLTRILNGKDGEKIRKQAAVMDLATPMGEVMVPRADAVVDQ